jgi:glycosyltransferase involved in cell wall biosynthesis
VRILHVIQNFDVGGAERVVATLERAMIESGHDVAVAAAPGILAGELRGPFFELPMLHRRRRRVPAAALALAKALRTFRADLVHCHNPGMAAVGGLATLRGRRVASLVSVHGVPDDDYAAAARVLRLAGLAIVACAPGVGEALVENGLAVRATVANGISPPPEPADRAALERAWRIPPGTKLVICVGRLAAAKDQATAIRALAGVPNAVLALVGDGPLKAELQREARLASVGDRVVFAGARHDARALIGAADAAVSSSRSEGLPLAVLEALAAGTPLVVTDIRGNRDVLGSAAAALMVSPGDARRMGEALHRVLTDPGLAERLTAAGRDVASRYTDTSMVAAYRTLYDSLLAERGPA